MKHKNTLLILTTSIFFYSLFFNLSYLNIFNVNWLYNVEEFQAYQIAFEFYKNDIWRWPITSNPNYGINTNNNILLSDNVVFLNIFFKLISNFFTSNFQFFGIWIFICFFFQSFFSYKIFYFYTKNFKYSFLCSIFFIILPILIDRIYIHLALSAHWLIIWAIYLSIKDISQSKFNLKWVLLFTIAILTNLYIFLMVAAIFTYSNLVNFNNTIGFKFKILLLNYVYFLLILYVIGFFDLNVINYLQYGFGYYKSNLLTFFDATGGFISTSEGFSWSLLDIFDIKNINGENEGFGYLGLGGIVLLFILLYLLSFQKKNIIFKISVFALIFFFVSLSNNIHISNYNLITFDLNKYLLGLFSFIRASGRFIWLVYYIICISSFVLIYKHIKKINPLALAAIIILIQLVDISKIFLEKKNIIKENKSVLNSNFWKEEVYGKYNSLIYTFPTGASAIQNKYIDLLSNSKFSSTNITYQARIDQSKLAVSRYELYKKLDKKNLNNTDLIIIDPKHLVYLNYIYKNQNFKIMNVDGFWLLMNKNNLLTNKFNEKKLQKYLPKYLEFNKSYDYNEISPYLGLGWYKSKSLWSEGDESTIIFSQYKKPKKILIYCEIFNYKNKPNNFEFKLNEKRIKDVNISKKNDNFLIELNAENIANKGTNILKILNKSKVSRLDLLIAPDGRRLGINFKKLVIY